MNTQIEILLRNSVAYLKNAEPSKAQLLLKKILELDKNNFDALRVLGVIAAMEGDSELALDLTNQAISAMPGDPHAYLNRGNIYQSQYFLKALSEITTRLFLFLPLQKLLVIKATHFNH